LGLSVPYRYLIETG